MRKTEVMDWATCLLHERLLEEYPEECPAIDIEEPEYYQE